MASLKLDDDRIAVSKLDRDFHGRKAVASLKLVRRRHRVDERQRYFHGRKAVASLKREDNIRKEAEERKISTAERPWPH